MSGVDVAALRDPVPPRRFFQLVRVEVDAQNEAEARLLVDEYVYDGDLERAEDVPEAATYRLVGPTREVLDPKATR